MNNKIFVTQCFMPPYEEYINEIKNLWDTAIVTNMGIYHQKLEKQLKEYLNVPNLSLITNGHLALELIIQAMELSGEVITTPFTFASTTHAIVRNNLKPVFCDIKYDDYTMDPYKIESLITDKTSAILPVHVFGQMCNIEEINNIARKYNLKVIYDAAHTFGVKYKKRSLASYGDASILSFHATKVFNTIEGGAIIFKDKYLENKIYNLKNFGIRSKEIVESVGLNAKMDEFRAIMGLCNLKYVESTIQKRRKIALRYYEKLHNIKGIKLLSHQKDVISNFAYFPVVFEKEKLGIDRDNICTFLEKENIFPRKYFYPLVTEFECYKKEFSTFKTPVAKYVSDGILTLPIYPDLQLEVVDYICERIQYIINK